MKRRILQPLLTVSLVLNLAMGIFTVTHSQRTPMAAIALEPPAAQKPAPTSVNTHPGFQWSQLDSPDFATFVKNLRGIGCPEPTIRDIVRGELTEIYAEKRQKPGTGLPQAELQRLDMEQAQLMAQLMSAPDGHAPASKASTAASFTNNPAFGIPAAFLVGNTASTATKAGTLPTTVDDPTLEPTMAAQLDRMRSQFAQTLERETHGADPASPLYQQRWLKVQRDQDEFFSSMYGGDAFVRVQLEAMRGTAADK